MGGVPVGDIEMAAPALERRHPGRIFMGVMTVPARVLLQGRVRIGPVCFIRVAGRT